MRRYCMKVEEAIRLENWTKGFSYADVERTKPVLARSADALKRCVRGWVDFTYPNSEKIVDRLNNWAREQGFAGIGAWNDAPEREFPQVLALCKQMEI